MRNVIVFCLLVGITAGCGGQLPSTPVEVKTASLKEHLAGLSESGYLGSGVETVREAFAELEKSDAAKASAIKEEFEELMKADGNPAKVKQLARQLAEKL